MKKTSGTLPVSAGTSKQTNLRTSFHSCHEHLRKVLFATSWGKHRNPQNPGKYETAPLRNFPVSSCAWKCWTCSLLGVNMTDKSWLVKPVDINPGWSLMLPSSSQSSYPRPIRHPLKFPQKGQGIWLEPQKYAKHICRSNYPKPKRYGYEVFAWMSRFTYKSSIQNPQGIL